MVDPREDGPERIDLIGGPDNARATYAEQNPGGQWVISGEAAGMIDQAGQAAGGFKNPLQRAFTNRYAVAYCRGHRVVATRAMPADAVAAMANWTPKDVSEGLDALFPNAGGQTVKPS